MHTKAAPSLVHAGIWRRLAALAYEFVLLFAIVFVAGYLFVALAGRSPTGVVRLAFLVYLIAICGTYFVYCWTRTGQTLALKTWGLKVVTREGQLLTTGQAILRFLLAIIGIGTTIGLFWAAIDPERQFLHDRLTGSCVIFDAGTNAADTRQD